MSHSISSTQANVSILFSNIRYHMTTNTPPKNRKASSHRTGTIYYFLACSWSPNRPLELLMLKPASHLPVKKLLQDFADCIPFSHENVRVQFFLDSSCRLQIHFKSLLSVSKSRVHAQQVHYIAQIRIAISHLNVSDFKQISHFLLHPSLVFHCLCLRFQPQNGKKKNNETKRMEKKKELASRKCQY